MDKLVALLNEYDKEEGLWNKWEEDEQGLNNMWKIYDYHSKLKIISKEYGFIKWLVDNDKIDLDKVKTLKSGHNAELFDFLEWLDGTMEVINYHYFEDYEQLLMLLSIQDNPIEFLVSILR